MRLSTVYLLLTDGFANAGVIYGQTPEKPVESRDLRLERLHLTLPKIEYPMLCWSIKMLEISLSNITTQHRIVEVLSSYDALTENNQKQIKLLEEVVQRSYKGWLVDLRFPGYETTPNTDSIPDLISK